MRPIDIDQDLSTIVLGTMRSPGLCVLSGHDRVKNWDVQKAKGQSGASNSLNGDDPGTFKATFFLADDRAPEDGPSQFDVWEEFQRLIESTTNGPAPFALPIYHPDLARNLFTEVSNGGVSGMLHDGKGGASVVVTFKEYKPAKAKPTAKAQGKASAGGVAPGGAPGVAGGAPPRPDPNAAAKAELAALLAEARQP